MRRCSCDRLAADPNGRVGCRALLAGTWIAIALATVLVPIPTASSPSGEARRVHVLADFQVTKGHAEEARAGWLVIDDPEVRAVLRSGAARVAGLDFEYRGPTARSAPLASGRVRRQVALKLRARDGCNVVYVAWRIAPERGIEVTVKRNPGLTRHVQCGARGYSRLVPDAAVEPPVIERGTRHSLEAALDGRSLRVRADGALVWEGRMPADALDSDGPAGLRTDNGKFSLAFWTRDLANPDEGAPTDGPP